MWVALEWGLASSGVGMVAVWVRFLGGRGLLVGAPGGRLGGGAGRLAGLPSGVVVLPVHGGLPVGGVGLVWLRWWVLVVVGVVVVVAAAVVVVVVVVVLRIFPQDPVALWWDRGLGHHLQPLGLQGLVDGWGGFGGGLDGDRG